MSRRPSPVRALVSTLAVLILALIFLPLLPGVVAQLTKNALAPEASGGPYTAADAEQCHAAKDELRAFPGEDASEAEKLSLGLEVDVPTARAQAAAASARFAAMARAIEAPASEVVLDQYASAFEAAMAKFAAPMTVSDFRSEFRSLEQWSTTWSRHCQAPSSASA